MRRLWWASLMLSIASACDEGFEPDADPAGAESAETSGDADAESEGGSGGGGGEEIDCEDQPVITYHTFGQGFVSTYCAGCHGAEVADRLGAPAEVVFDTQQQAASFADRILARSAPPDGEATMPPAGGIVAEDTERLRIWLTCFP